MTTVYIDAESAVGVSGVIIDPDGTGFQIQVPDATLEVSSAQLNSIIQASIPLLGLQLSPTVKPAFYGDSNFLLRPGVTNAQTFPALMSTVLGASTYGMFAVAGETSGNGLARIQAVLDYTPTHVFLDFGVNDADPAKAVTSAQYESNMRSIIAQLQAKGIQVVLMSPIFIAQTGYLESQRDTYMPVWFKLARLPGLITVDCYTKMAAITMQSTRANFDALTLVAASDVQHWSPAGNSWRTDRCKQVMGL